ncbi:MAG TPA: SseB family protein [Longimicrobiaceae bacterium]
MPFEPQNELERSLVRAATDPAHRARFYRDLLEADLYVIDEGPPPEQPGWRVSDGPAQLRVGSVETDGLRCIPVFSSVPRLQAAIDREVAYVGMRARDLLGIFAGADLVLNPGSDYGRVLTADEVRGVLDGSPG